MHEIYPNHEKAREIDILTACERAFSKTYRQQFETASQEYIFYDDRGQAEFIRLGMEDKPFHILLSRPSLEAEISETGFWVEQINKSLERYERYDYMVVLRREGEQLYYSDDEGLPILPVETQKAKELTHYIIWSKPVPLKLS